MLELRIEGLVPDPSSPILCYCGGGSRSALAADSLQKMGYTNVASVARWVQSLERSRAAERITTDPPSTIWVIKVVPCNSRDCRRQVMESRLRFPPCRGH